MSYEQRLIELSLRQSLWIMRQMIQQTEATGGGRYRNNPDTRALYQQAKDFIKKMDHYPDSQEYPEKP